MVGWPRCAYPSIHFFVSRSRSVVDCAHIQAFTLKLSRNSVGSKHSCVCCGGDVCVQCGVCACVVVSGVLCVSVGVCVCVGMWWCVRCGVCVLCVVRLDGDFLKLHTERREGRRERGVGRVLFSLSLVHSLSLSLLRRALSLLFVFSLPSLVFSLFSQQQWQWSLVQSALSLSLSVNTALTCLSVSVRGLRSIPCLANMLSSCMKQLS